jgi:aryl-alcohol dehydrogenase-like predicted oxidoreductase
MRLSTDADADDAAFETIAAAAEAGISIFDTAHAYGAGEAPAGRNERLVAQALRGCGAEARARIITKGGMTRAGGGWVPDGRARAISTDCDASLAALAGLTIDIYLLHAPDPRTPWRTSVRALARLLEDGAVRHVGLSNVNHRQLEEACDLVDIAAVEVGLSVLDDSAVRGGIVEFCAERGIAVIAHSPLGGPSRARSLARRQELVDIARTRDATAEEVALAWVLDLSPVVVAIPGARHPETIRSAARAANLRLEPDDRARIVKGFGWPQPGPAESAAAHTGDADVVVVMGIPGAGKSRHAEDYVARGYVRLNRDDRGGSLRELNVALDGALASGVRRVVLDNTYLTRVARSHVIETAARHGGGARCVWVDTPLAQAQVNLVERLLDRFGSLPRPEELRVVARREPGIMLPASQMRTFRELEPPSTDEGFTDVVRIPFERDPRTPSSQTLSSPGGVFVSAAALRLPGWEDAVALGDPRMPHLVFDWRPGEAVDVLNPEVALLSAQVAGIVTSALCPHDAGVPVCWCRPPLPGLILAFTRAHGIDPSHATLIGASPAHRTLANTLGVRYITARGAGG